MKVVEIIKLSMISLKMLQASCIKMTDVCYVPLYDDYLSMLAEGHKKSYIVVCLAERYHLSERKVYYLLNSFSRDCTIGAV